MWIIVLYGIRAWAGDILAIKSSKILLPQLSPHRQFFYLRKGLLVDRIWLKVKTHPSS